MKTYSVYLLRLKKMLLFGSICSQALLFQNCSFHQQSYAASPKTVAPPFQQAKAPQAAPRALPQAQVIKQSLKLVGTSSELSQPHLYLFKPHRKRTISVSLPAGAVLAKKELTLTKLRGNCSKESPELQLLKTAKAETNSGDNTLIIPGLHDYQKWQRQYQGCEFTLSAQIILNGQAMELETTLDALYCSDGEFTQLSHDSPDCQEKTQPRSYISRHNKPFSYRTQGTL